MRIWQLAGIRRGIFVPVRHCITDPNGLVRILLVLAVRLPIPRCFDHLVQHLLMDRHGPVKGPSCSAVQIPLVNALHHFLLGLFA